eukprot:352987-Chlamydomonas_euryale.AAC.1
MPILGMSGCPGHARGTTADKNACSERVPKKRKALCLAARPVTLTALPTVEASTLNPGWGLAVKHSIDPRTTSPAPAFPAPVIPAETASSTSTAASAGARARATPVAAIPAEAPRVGSPPAAALLPLVLVTTPRLTIVITI